MLILPDASGMFKSGKRPFEERINNPMLPAIRRELQDNSISRYPLLAKSSSSVVR